MARSTPARAALLAALLSSACLTSHPVWARDNLADARASLAKGDLRTAQIQLRNAVRDDPQNATAHFELARLSLQLGDGAAAEREARAALDRGYDASPATELLAQSYLAQNRGKDLLRDLTPDGKPPEVAARILVARGFAQLAIGEVKQAQESLEKAEQAAPKLIEPLLADSRLSMAMRDPTRAKAKLDQALALEPENADVLTRKSEIQRADGDTDGAIATLTRAIDKNGSLLPQRLDRAGLLIAANKDDAARADIDIVLKALPNSTQATYLRAVLLFRAKDLSGADALLTKLGPAMSSIPRAFFLTAIVKQQLGQLSQATEAADRFLARAPEDLSAQKLVAEIALRTGKPERTIEVLQATADSPRADIGVYDLIARGFAATNNQARAVSYFEKATTLAPDDTALRQRLAASRMSLGDTEKAVGDYQKSFDLSPKDATAGAQLFFADLSTGDLDRAGATLDKIRAAQGDTPIVQGLDGQLKMSRLDNAGARAVFEKLVREHPEFPQGRVSLARLDMAENRTADAQEILTGLLKDQPTSEPALTMMVTSLFGQNKSADAIAVLTRAHAAAPNDARLSATLADAYTRANDPAKAIKFLSEPAVGTDAAADLLAARARAQLAMKDEVGAEASYRAILGLIPRAVEARRVLAGLMLKAGNAESARTLIEEGMKTDPRDMRLAEDYVGLDLKTKGLDAALSTAERLRRNAADVPGMALLRGDAYLQAQKMAEAADAYAAELKARPDQTVMLRLVNAYVLLNKRDEAIAELRTWVAAHPDDQAAPPVLAGLLISTSNPQDAEPVLTGIVAKNPRDATSLNNLAWLYSLKKDPRALPTARRAYLLGPSPATADTLGWILVNEGDAAKGVVLLRQASADGKNPQILYHLAVALRDTGNKAEAVSTLTALTKSDAQFEEKPQAEKMLSELSKT